SDAAGVLQTALIGAENSEQFVAAYPLQLERMSRFFLVGREHAKWPGIIGGDENVVRVVMVEITFKTDEHQFHQILRAIIWRVVRAIQRYMNQRIGEGPGHHPNDLLISDRKATLSVPK